MACSFFRGGKPRGLFNPGEESKCIVLGTTIPDIRKTKFCEGDFFECKVLREEMQKKGKEE